LWLRPLCSCARIAAARLALAPRSMQSLADKKDGSATMAPEREVGMRGLSRVLLALMGLVAMPAWAQDFPNRPVKLITQGAAASGPDVVARIIFDQLGRMWGQQPVIMNVVGAGGSTAARQAHAATPDGYTLYMPAASAFIVMPEMFPNLPFDLTRDFATVGFAAEQPFVIGVSPALGINTLPELIALSKAKPGTITFAANSRGTLPHLTVERLRVATGADFTFIPYPGAAAGLQDVMGGRVSMVIEGFGTLMGAVQGGTLKPLAVTSLKRLPDFPNIPTVAETIPNFISTGWFAVLGPGGTPDAIVRKVNADMNKAAETPEVKSKFAALATFTRPMTPEETAAFVKNEKEVWKPVVKQVGFTPQQ
jgi:tripartite-type tricarboxylate transporter receptor subunit TctC